MIDPKYILDKPTLVQENNRKRGASIDFNETQVLARKRLALIEQSQQIHAESNRVASEVAQAKPDERAALIEKGRAIKEQMKQIETEAGQIEQAFFENVRKYPNFLKSDVPIGVDDGANQTVRTFLEPTVFSFEPKDHLALGEELGMIDIERAGVVSGARFVYLKGDAVLLEFALVQYALQTVLPEKFIPVLPPHLISIESMAAMGYLEHGGEEEIYHLKNDPMVLIGTSEQSIGPMHKNEILDESSLPLRYMGFSPCYRREAGSYGKDTRGILRMHQFDKIEMFSYVLAEASDDEHEFLLSMEEKLMQGLKLPYRVMKLCSGDTGRPSARTYDIETWMPSQGRYRETHSTSNTTDFQTRRLNIRVKHEGKNVLVHALNGTAFAVGRILIAILENNQQSDGSVIVPEVLRPWVGKEKLWK